VTGGISKVDDAMVRTALYEAANAVLSRPTRFSTLKCWAMEVTGRRGLKRAKVALACRMGTVLHRMSIDGTEFRWGKQAQAATAWEDNKAHWVLSRTDRRVCSCSPRSRRRDAGTSEAGSSAVEALRGTPRVLDWPAGSLSDRIMWRPRVDRGRKHETGGVVLTREA
jgi:hypothetical protein